MKKKEYAPYKEYIRTDRNGTKYYNERVDCGRCGGTGFYGPIQVFNGECFDCNKRGWVIAETKEYTPEHRAKLDAKAEAARAKKTAEHLAHSPAENAAFMWRKFEGHDHICAILGKTYELKDELKAEGCFYRGEFDGWCAYETKRPCVKVPVDDLIETTDSGWVRLRDDGAVIVRALKEIAEKALRPVSEHVGKVGERITCDIVVEDVFSYKCKSFAGYGMETRYINKFRTADGNILVWQTSAPADEKATKITGTVKAHDDYKGEKQTTLQRCKLG